MSGPKVVRIVTREEIVAICEGHLRQLDQAIAIWARDGQRIGELTDAELAATLERRHALGKLLRRDAFTELQKKVPDEIAFMKTDLERRRQLAIDKLAKARQRQRQGRENAGTLIKTLASRGVAIPARLQMLASGQPVDDADVILAQGFALLAPVAASGLSDLQRERASQLMGDEHAVLSWKASPSPNPRIERIDRQIAELSSLVEADQLTDFSARLNAIEASASGDRQQLLLDSLIIDLASVIGTARAQQAAAADSIVQSVSAETSDDFAMARRKAILQGLAKLGYDVHEGMETAWAKDGQVVAKKASLPGYGVELGGQAHTGRLQIRTVAFSAKRDTSRDKDVETIWCGEFSRLQTLLAEHGNDLLIERALGVGAAPLKVVHTPQQDSRFDTADLPNTVARH